MWRPACRVCRCSALRMGQVFGYTVVGGTDGLGSVVIGSAVPEPATWAMMIAGFGMIGGALRSRRKAAVSFG